MIVVENTIPVKKEYWDKFEKLFTERESHLAGVPGFIRNEVMRPLRGNEYIVMTHWESLEHFRKWMNSDAFKKAHSGETLPDEAYDGENEIAIHEVFLTS